MITVCKYSSLMESLRHGARIFRCPFRFSVFLAAFLARERKIRTFRYVSRYLGWISRKEIRRYYFPAYSRVRRAAAYNKRSISEEFISGLLVGRNNVTRASRRHCLLSYPLYHDDRSRTHERTRRTYK